MSPPTRRAPTAQAQFVRRDDANMAAATVAIVSVDGAPADLSAHFNQSLDDGRGRAPDRGR